MIETVRARVAASTSATGPKYRVLRDAILDAIASGDWQPGARLPTESEFSQRLPYSLGTIQKAYGELVKSGMVVRSRGRGSFVAPGHRQLAEPWHCRFLDDDGAILPVYPRFLGHGAAGQDPRWERLFGPDSAVLCIHRALSINDEFDVVSHFFARDTVVRPLLDRPHEQVETANFKATLLRELGIPISRIVQTVATMDRRSRPTSAIGVRPHLLLEATAYTGRGEVAYFQQLYIPRNRRKLLFDSEFEL